MYFVKEIPFWVRLVYKFYGVIPFPLSTPATFSSIVPHLYCLPFYIFYTYTCTVWLQDTINSAYSIDLIDYIDVTLALVSIFAITTSVVSKYWISNKISLLLEKVQDMKVVLSCGTPKKRKYHFNWSETILVTAVVVNYALTLFTDESNFIFFCYIPSGVCCLNHLFLSNVLRSIRDQFDLINHHLQRQVNSVDLVKIFPLTRHEKIKQLKEKDVASNIRHIEQLSLFHYDLVHLAKDINSLFDVTTIVSMAMWFSCVVDASYDFVYFVVNKIEPDAPLQFWYIQANLLFFLLWLFVMVRMYSRTQQSVRMYSV
jgi:ABC-type multidrug transport system fused ATPase/permease subunit